MESVILYSFLVGIFAYLITALLFGKYKATRLFGGAAASGILLSVAMSVPFYVGLAAALAGHYLTAYIAKHFSNG